MSKLMFLEIDGIKGECRKKGFEGKIEILAWSWGVSSSYKKDESSISLSTYFPDVSITKWLDSATIALIENITSSKTLSEVRLTTFEENALEKPEIEYVMKNAKIISFSTTVSNNDTRLTENFTLDFSELEFYAYSKILEKREHATLREV